MVGLTTALGAFIGELFLRYRSTYLAAWIHGVFNSQVYGIWPAASRDVHPFLGGYAGLVGIVVWTTMALGAVAYHRRAPVSSCSPAG